MRGTVNEIRSTASRKGSPQVQVCVDFVAYAPHRRIDVQAFDIDFGVFSYYKVSTLYRFEGCKSYLVTTRSTGHTLPHCTRVRKHTHLSHRSHTTSLILQMWLTGPHLSSFNLAGRVTSLPMEQQQYYLISYLWADPGDMYQKQKHLGPHSKGLRCMKGRS